MAETTTKKTTRKTTKQNEPEASQAVDNSAELEALRTQLKAKDAEINQLAATVSSLKPAEPELPKPKTLEDRIEDLERSMGFLKGKITVITGNDNRATRDFQNT